MRAALLSLVVSLGCSPAPQPPPPLLPPPVTVQSKLLDLHNAARETPLQLDERLTRAAQDHADWMAERGRMSHRGDGGSNPGQRIVEAGYSWSTYGENVAYGQETAADVMAAWMRSPGHRRNITSRSYADLGVGIAVSADGQRYWCTTFGSESYNGEEWSDSWSEPEGISDD